MEAFRGTPIANNLTAARRVLENVGGEFIAENSSGAGVRRGKELIEPIGWSKGVWR